MTFAPPSAPAHDSLRRRAIRLVPAVACALGVWLLLAASPSVAKVIHQPEGSFNGSERPTYGAFGGSLPSDAVDRSSADVWVTEAKFFGVYGKASVVDKFDLKGEYAGVQITGSGTPKGEFAFGAGIFAGIAVDNSASGPHKGDLYVSDTEHGVVDRFSSSGAFECEITGTKPSTAEEIAHECAGATGSEPAGGPAGLEPAGLAVDSAGDVYVADREHNAIDKFGPSGEYMSRITDGHLGSAGSGLGSIALDSAGNVYVTNYAGNVVKLDSTGHFVEVLTEGEGVNGVAVDPTNNNVYVSIRQKTPMSEEEERTIAEYEPSGKLLDVFAQAQVSGFFRLSYIGLAVGPTGKVYAAEPLSFSGGVQVLVYGSDVTVPNVTTQAATISEERSATLRGQIDPDAAHGGGEVTSCRFEYGPTKAYGESAPCTPAPLYSAPESISAAVNGLRPASTYHFRLEASNANGVPSYGEDETMTTKGPPSVDYEEAEALTTFVVFKAKINPWGSDTTCQVQYGTESEFQQSKWADAVTMQCQPEHVGSGFGDVKVKLRVDGLARHTTYHYRFLATNQAGLAGHPEGTFETYGIDESAVEDLKSSRAADPTGWEPGEQDTQAGGHPYEVVTNLEFSHTTGFSNCPVCGGIETEFPHQTLIATKDIHVELPPGLLGNPNALPKCNRYLVNKEDCPPSTEVGLIELWPDDPLTGTPDPSRVPPKERRPGYTDPLFNLEPSGRYPAEFGAFIEGQAPAWIAFHLRTGSDYGVSADSLDIVSTLILERVRVRVWGIPADPAHNAERRCPFSGAYKEGCSDPEPPRPLLSNPTTCSGPVTTSAAIDSWQEEGAFTGVTTQMPGFTGCGKLSFEPSFEARPTSTTADSPSGLHVDLHMPQPEACKEESGKVECELAEADLRDATVTLPAGVTINPSSADGLEACSEAQIGYLPQQSVEVGYPQFTPEAAECPDSSQVGKVEVDSPLVDHPLVGGVYVAQQDANPFKSLLALYIAVYDPATGVVIKLPGKVAINAVTGQLTSTFDRNPQLPFEDFKLDLFPGSRAALTTPLTCGSYVTDTDLTPWSSPEGADAMPSSPPFSVTGPGGGACVGSEAQAPNSPGFEAGTASPVAGAYSPFILHLVREDGSQHFGGLNVTLPPGLVGKIAGLEQCSQAAIEAAQGRSHEGEGALELAHPSCPTGSEVGVVHVGAGSGAPYYVTGHAYFAGPYKGAPFSLVIVTPAVAGPFDLGTVVVRAALYIDPNTAQVTVKSDPFPTILDGIPLDVRSVGVEVNRKEFTLNPTSCSVMSVTGLESSMAGQTAALSDRFQAGGCTTLPFRPSFAASTSGVTSRREGASLVVHVGSSVGQANIAKVHVTLPRQLPSRLETLKLACSEGVFAANPASCPRGSAVGTAVAHTPILSSPLAGPAYIVSHGSAAFPDLELVLQGEGVTIVLDGKTDIENGITTSTFETVPDAPVSSFELDLPERTHSILAAPGGSLCSLTQTVLVKRTVTVKVRRHGHVRQRRVTRMIATQVGGGLVMPTVIQGQNGAVISQNTPIEVTGCPAAAARQRTNRHAPGAGTRRNSHAGRRHKTHGHAGRGRHTTVKKQRG